MSTSAPQKQGTRLSHIRVRHLLLPHVFSALFPAFNGSVSHLQKQGYGKQDTEHMKRHNMRRTHKRTSI